MHIGGHGLVVERVLAKDETGFRLPLAALASDVFFTFAKPPTSRFCLLHNTISGFLSFIYNVPHEICFT